MRTTLVIPDELMVRARREAGRQGRSLSAWVTEAVARRLADLEEGGPQPRAAFALPRRAMGEPRVDLADRAALERAMDD